MLRRDHPTPRSAKSNAPRRSSRTTNAFRTAFQLRSIVRVRIRPGIETYGSAVRPSFSGGRLRAERRLATASHGGARGLKVVGSETRRVVSLI
jgi:hypothetical protein